MPLWPMRYTLVVPSAHETLATLRPVSTSQPRMSTTRPGFPSPPGETVAPPAAKPGPRGRLSCSQRQPSPTSRARPPLTVLGAPLPVGAPHHHGPLEDAPQRDPWKALARAQCDPVRERVSGRAQWQGDGVALRSAWPRCTTPVPPTPGPGGCSRPVPTPLWAWSESAALGPPGAHPMTGWEGMAGVTQTCCPQRAGHR